MNPWLEARLEEEADARAIMPTYSLDLEPPSSIFTTLRYSEAMMCWDANECFPLHRSRFYMLRLHINRLRNAVDYFRFPSLIFDYGSQRLEDHMADVASSKLMEHCKGDISLLHTIAGRVRVTITNAGEARVECTVIPSDDHEETYFPKSLNPPDPFDMQRQSPPIYELFLCPFSIEPLPYTRFKTNRREMYTAARAAVGLPAQPTSDPVEVLCWSPGARITEGSLTSVYFYRYDRNGEGRWITPTVQCGGNEGTTRKWALLQGLCIESIVTVDGEAGVKEGEHCWISNGLRGFNRAVVRRQYYDRGAENRRDVETRSIPIMTPTSEQSKRSPASAGWASLSSAENSNPVTR